MIIIIITAVKSYGNDGDFDALKSSQSLGAQWTPSFPVNFVGADIDSVYYLVL